MQENENQVSFAVGKQNLIYILVGFGVIILGFILMAGGKPDSPEVFNPEVFSFTRITLAPLVVLGGFIFIIWAIMKKPKHS